MSLVAGIDIGTNSFRMLVAEKDNCGRIYPLLKERETVRLGEGFKSSLMISNEAICVGVKTLKKFKCKIDEKGITRYAAVATGVLRKAKNAAKFLEKVSGDCNLKVKVLSGYEEALLTLEGVALVFPEIKAKGEWLILDIGGGSTEFIYCESGDVRIVKSIDLGGVTMADTIRNDPPLREDLESLENELEKVLYQIKEEFECELQFKKPIIIGTAGTVTTLASMKLALREYNAERINGFLLKKEEVLWIYKKILPMKIIERERLPGLEKGRGKIIIPGCLILLKIMEYFRVQSILVCAWGLLEGVIKELV